MTSDIPERLRERAKAIARGVDFAGGQVHIDRIALALHEIEQAARAEGERAGAEAMREAAAVLVATLAERPYDIEPEFSALMDCEARIRALPTPAVPAKEA